MFNLSYNSPCPIQGHLKLKRCPAYYGVGIYEAENGVMWDVQAIYGDRFIQARPVDSSYIYSTTGEIRGYSARWLPYTYEPTFKKADHERG